MLHEQEKIDELLRSIKARLAHARKKHPVFATDMKNGLYAIKEEVAEMREEVLANNEARALDECLDVVATCIRFLLGEWK